MNDVEALEEYVKNYTDLVNLPEYDAKIVFKAIENLLKERQEDKERIKELEETDLTTVYIKGFNDAEEKWKNKIKNKMEELNKKTKDVDVTEAIFMIKQQQVLDSVLKESD